jgi:diaminopimelate decarboxylase
MRRFEEFFVKDGRFEADGVGLEQMLARQATPFYIYSASAIRAKYRLLKARFPRFDICYSLKANPNVELCRLLASEGAGAEVSSSGELRAALAAGFKPGDIVYVAPVKFEADIEFALTVGIYAFVVDSAYELAMIDRVAARLDARPRILLRINTTERRPEAKEVMVGGPSKFGFDEEKVAVDVRPAELACAVVCGIQVYSASQVLDAGFLAGHVEYVARLAVRLSRELGFELGCIDFGGGFGIPYNEGDPELDLGAVATATDTLPGIGVPSDCRLLLESGRFLVAEAGVFVTRVERVKESRGRTFAICDAGMNGFSRPVFMGIRHPLRLLNKLDRPVAQDVDVCGPICTPLDCIGSNVKLPMPEPGDTVGVLNAGAYGYTMSLLDFMSLGRPAEILADDGSLRIVRSSEPAGQSSAR